MEAKAHKKRKFNIDRLMRPTESMMAKGRSANSIKRKYSFENNLRKYRESSPTRKRNKSTAPLSSQEREQSKAVKRSTYLPKITESRLSGNNSGSKENVMKTKKIKNMDEEKLPLQEKLADDNIGKWDYLKRDRVESQLDIKKVTKKVQQVLTKFESPKEDSKENLPPKVESASPGFDEEKITSTSKESGYKRVSFANDIYASPSVDANLVKNLENVRKSLRSSKKKEEPAITIEEGSPFQEMKLVEVDHDTLYHLNKVIECKNADNLKGCVYTMKIETTPINAKRSRSKSKSNRDDEIPEGSKILSIHKMSARLSSAKKMKDSNLKLSKGSDSTSRLINLPKDIAGIIIPSSTKAKRLTPFHQPAPVPEFEDFDEYKEVEEEEQVGISYFQ